MFWEDETEIAKTKQSLAEDFQELLDNLMKDYLSETEKQLDSLDQALRAAKKFDAFGNEITPEGKDEEVWEYFVEKNLWENIFNVRYKQKQARYLDRLENFLSDTIYSPDKHLEKFGHGLLWRYYAKFNPDGSLSYEYMKTDNPLTPLVITAKEFNKHFKSKKVKDVSIN